VSRVLLVRLDGIGDALVCTPLIAAFIANFVPSHVRASATTSKRIIERFASNRT